MARDLALLEGSGSVLRLYSWDRPTVSLGYSQRWTPSELPWVRRPTGGRALLHTRDEITYAIALDVGDVRVDEAFCYLTGTLREALNALGVPVTCSGLKRSGGGSESCLALVQRGELLLGERKLVGSAQARRGGRLLQHGAIPFFPSHEQHERVFGEVPPVVGMGVRMRPEELAEEWGRTLGVTWGESVG